MMSGDVIIRAEGLGKKYRIGHQAERERYVALRDVMARGARGLWRKAADMARGHALLAGDSVEELWALKDVSFEVRRGEVLGIIGRNGAGKSTLLKILARITEPSAGRVAITGRVASLLEVGTGFHPELTGRENIFLNGAILGMTRAEIRRKFDEIVAFAEVEKFLDTPVKRYSSGMYVRLAFAVAAHLEPEILVVDEVLAVGDAEFQKKCLGKMSDVAGGGRTVLFVSHNLQSVRQLCQDAILLDHGRLTQKSPAEAAIRRYLSSHSLSSEYVSTGEKSTPSIKEMRLHQDSTAGDPFDTDKAILIDLQLWPHEKKNAVVSIAVHRVDGLCVHHSSDEFSEDQLLGMGRRCTIPPHALAPGQYTVDAWLGVRNIVEFESIECALTFNVRASGRLSERTTGKWQGVCGPGLLNWSGI
jgi:lipopolysaccharide transport system ATP-binding protein